MKNKKLIAGVGGIALIAGLAGMGTFALWSDEAAVDGGVVTAGNLDVESIGTQWKDVTAGIPGGERVLGEDEIADYRVSPGDHLVLTQDLDIALEGANLRAGLNFNEITGLAVSNGVEYSVEIQNSEGEVLAPGDGGRYMFYSADNRNLDGVEEDFITPVELDNNLDVRVVVNVVFPNTVENRDYTGDILVDFQNVGVNFTQIPINETSTST